MTEGRFRELLARGLDGIARWESSFRPFEQHPSLDVWENAAKAIDHLVERLADNYPFFHPDYAGQMLRPPHAVALAAYAVAARINPNNHALDGGPATAQMERECVDQLAAMFGLPAPYLGHLTTSGTVANLEALWVARHVHPGKAIVISSEAHYTHARMCELLGLNVIVLPADACGQMDLSALESLHASDAVGTVVVTAGTTAAGAVDPIDAVVALASERGWRVHVDAAYGGFFATIARNPDAQLDPGTWLSINRAHSIVVDPHKHGLQPYGCGAVLFADPSVGAYYRHDSPYTYFTSKQLHLGEISLECSRPGAAAAALWATLQCFPLTERGLGLSLLASRRAALAAYDIARFSGTLVPVIKPELDIFTVAPLAPDEVAVVSDVSARSDTIFEQCMRDPKHPLFLAKWRLPECLGRLALPQLRWDEPHCTVLRSVMMKPEHEANARAIAERIAAWV
ncbi:MAG: aminotransferase class V-fold PLP-dependent enzyme [Candidatus Eremiobacteraeota bacterium]|nr:aminotransferase class V-fold PLP-dependent enzyme [Candidatus Eremiobacteraeota bacterium]